MPEVVQSAQVVAALVGVVVVVDVVHGSHSPQLLEAVVVVVVVVVVDVHGSHSPQVLAVVVVVVVAAFFGSQSVQVSVEAVVVVVVVVVLVVAVHDGSHSAQVLVLVFDGQSVTSGPQEVTVTSTEAATAATRPERMSAERILIV